MTYSVFPRIHSLYGRFLGITNNGYITGEVGVMERVGTFTSATTGTKVPSQGVNTFSVTTAASTTTGASYILDYPKTGVQVTLINLGGSTGPLAITSTAGNIIAGQNTMMGSSLSFANLSSASTAYTAITMYDKGAVVVLQGISTAFYVLKSIAGFSTGAHGAVMT